MSYGALFKGKDNNSCFSDSASSIVFMGKAVNTGVYGPSIFDRGGSVVLRKEPPFDFQYIIETANSGAVNGILMFPYRDANVGEVNVQGGTYYPAEVADRSDTAREVIFEVESYSNPIIFTRYSDPQVQGGLVVKVVDNGTTGPRGWPNWNISVWLFTLNVGNFSAAADSLEFYCFGRIPSDYTNNTGFGMVIKNNKSETMFHSDFKPARIKEIMNITTGVDPDINFSSSLLDPTGSVINTMSKVAYLSQDWGRLVTTFGTDAASFEYHHTPYSIEHTGGDNFHARFGEGTLHRFAYAPASKNFIGASNIIFPVIDGADYE